MTLTLAFDTATHVATVALVEGDTTLGERTTRAFRVLAEADGMLAAAGAAPADVARLVVGTGPGSFTGTRLGLALARGFAFARDVPVAGVSTLDALEAGAPGALPVVDAGRREVFTKIGGEARALPPSALTVHGMTCVGDGALRYRTALEALGATVPPDDSPEHVPRASLHARLATDFGDAASVQPVYVRAPDAKAPA